MVKHNRMRKCRRALACAALAISLFAGGIDSVLAGGLRASVNSSRVALGDSFTLTLSNDAGDRSPPDLSPLQKEFDILGTGQSSRTSIINGARTDTFAWEITLSPRAKGSITIPPLEVGNQRSNPVAMEIVEAGSLPAGASNAGNLSIDVKVEPGSHYVHEEIPVTVTIVDGVGMRDASLSEPAGGDFILKQSGEDEVSQAVQGGARVTVIERKYLLRPQKSGSLTVPPLTLRALVSDPNARRSPFGGDAFSNMFGRLNLSASIFDDIMNPGRRVAVRSEPVVIDVKARPTPDGGWFLPAREVQLRAAWKPAPPVFRVGEAVTRVVQLFALGASAEQLPDIALNDADGAKVYVDRSDDRSVDTASGTAALREFVTSVVPTRAGEISLPAIEIKWWDTVADIERVATLPAETLMVEGAAPATAPGSSNTLIAGSADTAVDKITGSDNLDEAIHYSWLSTAVGAAVLLIAVGMVLAVLRHRSSGRREFAQASGSASGHPPAEPSGLDRDRRIAQAYSVLVNACKQNDIAAAYAACMAWARLVCTDNTLTPSRLAGISPVMAKELASMEQVLYAGGGATVGWSGQVLLDSVAGAARPVAANGVNYAIAEILPPLYPDYSPRLHQRGSD